MPGKIMLRTARLVLREHTEDDAEAVYRLGSDPLVNRYIWDPPLGTVEQARAILRDHPIADYRKYGYGRWACVLEATGELIGFAGLKYLEEMGEVDLGYRLLPAHWGGGLATEAGRACVAYGLEVLGLARIIGLVHPDNVASVRVLEKCGLSFEALIDHRGQRLARYALHAPQGRASS
jgi:RimJ/RimL family protein N-acetyltransferase